MPKRSIRSWVLMAFACWLVILASGDDFNFARVVFLPSPPAPEDPLPLDDPNTDFTESFESRELPTTSRDRWGCTISVGQRLKRVVLTSPFAALALGHPPRPGSNAPLRC